MGVVAQDGIAARIMYLWGFSCFGEWEVILGGD